MPSIVIAAHNEEQVIGATLDALRVGEDTGNLEIIVSANGCSDRTAEVARRLGVRVIDRVEPGKAAALNAGDEVAVSFPRAYLDADIVLPPGSLSGLWACFDAAAPPLAVVPRRRLNTRGRPWLVRAYGDISERLPAFRSGLFGRGLIVLSESGRSRFDRFPELIADDLFLDSLFTREEKAEAADVVVEVEAPFTTRDLVRRLVRVRRGNSQMRAAAANGLVAVRVRPADRWAWLREVVAREPRLALASIAYVGLSLVAALLARRTPKPNQTWGRDESTRQSSRTGRSGE